jgi:tRNA pseudouridine38-40 synthase
MADGRREETVVPSFKVTLAYDGGPFVGWQRQASGTSIQGLLETVLRDLDGRDVAVVGAGRTDAGVHAEGQVASFCLERSITPDVLVRALNARLPGEVRVVAAEETAASFHARFGARSKTYCYRIRNEEVVSPFERGYVWHVPGPLEIDAMQRAASLLVGRHDFAAFQAAGGARSPTVRAIQSSRVEVPEPGLVTYEVSGDGFLRHMVRAIVGSLVEVGRGRHPVEWLRAVIASRDRMQAGPTAPAQGLYLVRVEYDDRAGDRLDMR